MEKLIKPEEFEGSIWGTKSPKKRLYCKQCLVEIEKFDNKGERLCLKCSNGQLPIEEKNNA